MRYSGPGKGILMSPRMTSSPPATKIEVVSQDALAPRVAKNALAEAVPL
jgi:hypothetical protein